MGEEDAVPYVRWLGDSEVAIIVGVTRIPTIKERMRQLELFNQSPSDLVLGIEIKESSKLIGTVAYREIDWNMCTAEAAIFIGDKNEWNKGYGTDAMKILLKIGFKELGLRKILVRVRPWNFRARHVFRKVGFEETKVGKEYILMTMEISKSDKDKV